MSAKKWSPILVAVVAMAAAWSSTSVPVSTQSPTPMAGSGAGGRGEAWFYQRCSLCHMGRIVKDDRYQPMAPRLDGVLKNATPEREKAVRTFIQVGSQRMPGFRYNFTPAEFEELMAYLKSL
jgi:mono/diheme cytochrome c family protein